MSNGQELRPFMRHRFTQAKSTLRWSERIGVAVGLLAVAVVFVPDSVAWAAWGGGLLSLGLLVTQQYVLYRFRKAYEEAEEVRRLCMLHDGLGGQVSAVKMASLRRRFGALEDNDGNAYYTSHLEAGPERLLMDTWESAFWSEDLQGHMAARFWWYAAVTTGLFVVAAIVVLVGPEGPLIPKVVVASMSFLAGLNFWGKWWGAMLVEASCRETCTVCAGRIRDGAKSDLLGVMETVLGYCATMLTADPPSDELYEKRKPVLNAEWERVVAELAPGGADEEQEAKP